MESNLDKSVQAYLDAARRIFGSHPIRVIDVDLGTETGRKVVVGIGKQQIDDADWRLMMEQEVLRIVEREHPELLGWTFLDYDLSASS